ncbi:BTAD domain-containing putative transcriptional regulator [Actinoplanes sp. L3-i22]|uniref:AfsR/SARP family transcriptional regulator n=1 Tax=Actinoplanes sp. L3-i22 TaxID=2836373 RepID=UPI001C771760|nr:BTAD domain-containing putative transcriptional regulator [Actinoplanes sp. L3-i22]BCY09645.1 hypothetical protein L3i22_047330 [Actinoplanes sp. L3-i22]
MTLFTLLGPIRAWRDGRELPIGSPQQRTVLAVLLLREGRLVTVDELVAALWDGEPPVNALAVVRTYISRLRRVLGGDADIRTYGRAYLLDTPAESVDVRQFRHLTERAGQAGARGEHEAAFRDLRAAAALYHGSPLAGAVGHFAEGQRHRLAELVLAAQLDLQTAGLGLGRHRQALPDLIGLAAEYPLTERVQELLLRALCQAGRQPEALIRYHELRRRLAGALGIDPGPGLQSLYLEMLVNDRPVALARS